MNRALIFFFIIFCSFAPKAHASQTKKTICLNMIVKDESDAIERCLGSVKHLIDYWVIVDTGSSDGTQEIIKKFMKDIPGELHERPWVDFAHNRNEALKFAKNKADYLLFIDADEIFEYSPEFALPPLTKDIYMVQVRQLETVDFRRPSLVNNHLNWRWEGILHECLECEEAKTREEIKGVINICNAVVGGRSKVSRREKYLKDAMVLEAALKKEPANSRYVYYLGQSYLAADEYEKAIQAFEKRIILGGHSLETYMAMYQKAIAEEKSDKWDTAIESYFKAYEFHPIRAEPLFHSAVLYRKKGNLLLGYLLSKHALTFPYPAQDEWVEYMSYDYAMLIEFANCALLLNKNQEGLDACAKLLANPRLPDEYKAQVTSNYELAKNRLSQDFRYTPKKISYESDVK